MGRNADGPEDGAPPAPRRTEQPGALLPTPAHGGTLAALQAAYPDAPRPWIDLSTGINPYPWPFPEPLPPLAPEVLTRLPEPGAIAALEQAAAASYGAKDAGAVTAAPGTQILISLLPRLWPARRVAVIGPTYSEHALAWRDAGAAVVEVPDLDRAVADRTGADGADVLVLVNPNNPDGRRWRADAILAATRAHRDGGGLVVVDEAFADLEMPDDPSLSLVPHGPPRGVVVLRSFGKSYGLAGVRLGFALAEAERTARLRAALGPWAVSGPAIAVGTAALADAAWRDGMAARLAREAQALDALVLDAGAELLGGTRLFRLVRHARAQSVAARLAAAGIAVRRFADRPELLRFGLPHGSDATRRLADALSATRS